MQQIRLFAFRCATKPTAGLVRWIYLGARTHIKLNDVTGGQVNEVSRDIHVQVAASRWLGDSWAWWETSIKAQWLCWTGFPQSQGRCFSKLHNTGNTCHWPSFISSPSAATYAVDVSSNYLVAYEDGNGVDTAKHTVTFPPRIPYLGLDPTDAGPDRPVRLCLPQNW